jgi:tetratricopeptide (TPR) repeat protein
MRKNTALWTLALAISVASGATAGEVASRSGRSISLTITRRMEAPPQAAKAPAWKSRAEYDAFTAMNTEKDPNKKIELAEAFIQKFSNSDFKDLVYVTEMQTYQQLNQTDKAIDAARKALEANPDNLPTLRFLSFTFPFLYKPDQPDSASGLARADADAHHGLEVLQKLQKPAGATDEQFQQGVKEFRAVFNSCIGFVALQKKDYPSAITALKAATDDNPSSWYALYWMSLAYLYSTPRDYDHAIWYGARAVDLAKAGKDPNADAWEKFLKQTYVGYHGTDTGLSDIEAQAASAANPPDGFKVAAVEAPKATGNNVIDAFNTLTFPLKLGGETAQKQWDAVKGQAIGLGGTVTSVEKGTDPNVYLVRIAVLDSTKSADGYDIELKVSTQPNVKNLQKGDLATFKGTLDSYVATPNLILTLTGEVTSDLPEKPAEKKPAAHKPVRKPNE